MGINPFQLVRFRHKGRVKIYQRLLEYIDRNLKYISDYWNISTTTQNISAIIEIYRLTDKTDNDSNFNNRGCAKILAHPLFHND